MNTINLGDKVRIFYNKSPYMYFTAIAVREIRQGEWLVTMLYDGAFNPVKELRQDIFDEKYLMNVD
jgi:hypothetical protein